MDPGQGLLLVDVPVPRHRVGGVVPLFQNIAKFGESISENWSLASVSRAFEVEVACIFPRGSTVAFAAGVGTPLCSRDVQFAARPSRSVPLLSDRALAAEIPCWTWLRMVEI